MDFTIQLKEKLPTMSTAQKHIAQFILDTPEAFVNKSIVTIGELTGTSAPSVTRFSKKMGFSSIDALKIKIAQDMIHIQNMQTLNPIFSAKDTLPELTEKTLDHIITSLKITTMQLDYTKLQQVIDAVLHAKMVYIYGIGASGLAAYDFYHKLNRAGKNAMYNQDTHMGIEFSYHTKPEDVAVGISYSGRTKEVMIPLLQAKKNGATSILITSSTDDKLHDFADIIIHVADTEELVRVGAISSKISTMYLLDLIFLGVLQHEFEDIQTDFLETANLVGQIKNK